MNLDQILNAGSVLTSLLKDPFGGSVSGPAPVMQPPITPQSPPQQPLAEGTKVGFSAQSWEHFRNNIQMIFGSTRTADIMERAFTAGRPVTDPSALRELKFLWKLMPFEGARTFEQWMVAAKILRGSAPMGGSGGGSNRFPEIPNVRTRRPL